MLERRERLKLEDGRELRLLSALEVLEARREAEGLARGEAEAALCANACLLARALERGGQPVFADGGAALAGLSAREIGALAGRWAAFDRAENPSPEDGEERLEGLKKAWSTRPMRPSLACAPTLWRASDGGAGQTDEGAGLSLVRPPPGAGPGGGAGTAVSRLPTGGGGGAVPGLRRAPDRDGGGAERGL